MADRRPTGCRGMPDGVGRLLAHGLGQVTVLLCLCGRVIGCCACVYAAHCDSDSMSVDARSLAPFSCSFCRERQHLLSLIAELQREVSNRSEARRTAEETAKAVVDSIVTFENRLLRVEQGLAHEMTKLRAGLSLPNSSSGTSLVTSRGGGAIGTDGSMEDLLRSLLRATERSIRQLFVGREESSLKQVRVLSGHGAS